MSSANRVRVLIGPEVTYGVASSGPFETLNLTSESLSGTPETTESQTIRADRQPSGQISTGLSLEGSVNMELAKEDSIDDLMEAAMFSTWQTPGAVGADLTITVAGKTIDRAAGDFNNDVRVGDVITLAGFDTPANNTDVMVAEIVDVDTIRYVGGEGMADEIKAGVTFKVADYLEIGTTQKSFSVEKAFQDLTNKAINYLGMLVNTMNLAFQYGEIATVEFGFNGNGYDPVDQAADFVSNGHTINNPATTNKMNGSIDAALIAEGSSGSFIDASYCINQLNLGLNNNLSARTCIGKLAPDSYSEGTAQIETSIGFYNADESWGLLDKKQDQTSLDIGFILRNSGGLYGFYLPAVQVSFEDPAAGGINQDIIISASGQAKIGPNNENAFRIYRK